MKRERIETIETIETRVPAAFDPSSSRGVAVPPDVRPRPARRPSVPGDHCPVPGTAVRFPELVIQPITVILPTSQTYPILRESSGVSRKKKASDPPIPIFSPDLLRPSESRRSGRRKLAPSGGDVGRDADRSWRWSARRPAPPRGPRRGPGIRSPRGAAVVPRRCADRRRDSPHQLRAEIVDRDVAAGVADLSPSGLAGTKPAKSLSDAACGESFRQLGSGGRGALAGGLSPRACRKSTSSCTRKPCSALLGRCTSGPPDPGAPVPTGASDTPRGASISGPRETDGACWVESYQRGRSQSASGRGKG